MLRTKLPACLRKYSRLIESVSDERGSGDGYWVYLVKGWIDHGGTHCVHEDTPEECAEMMSMVERCTEPGCCDE